MIAMALYKAKKGNEEFYIQPNMIEVYSLAGYTIIKLEEIVIKDIKKEAGEIAKESEEMSNG